MKIKTKFLVPALAACIAGMTTNASTVPEPSTLLYGKVLHRAYGSEYQLTSGDLQWTLRNQDGDEFTYTTDLKNIKDVFSYKVPIPHQALSSGLEIDPSVVPLAVGEDTYEFVSITVDGYPAAVLWSEANYLSLLQSKRAATYRIDLLVSFDLQDTDGDGMPDWWEQFYGLDWQLDDADLDPDGDGWSNLDEYFRGTNPFFDDRVPTLQTLELAAYGESNNGVWLRAVDANTAAADLNFTLSALPAGGYLHRLAESGADTVLENALSIGDSFSQADLNAGRIAYRHTDAGLTETSFSVSLSDGVHTATEAEVAIHVFPSGASEVVESGESASIPFWWREENVIFEAYWGLRENVLNGGLVESALFYLLGRDYDWTLWDQRLETLPVELAISGDGSHLIMGGSADDRLSGGSGDDIIGGGAGRDVLTGGAGIDLFIFAHAEEDEVADFELGTDVLDLGQLLAGKSGALDDFLFAQFDGADTRIGVDLDGIGGDYTGATVLLRGVVLTQQDLHRMWSDGQLITGAVQGRPAVSFVGASAESVEEGFDTASLLLRRQGPVSLPLSVQVNFSGSATNGNDYQILFDTVHFAPGSATATISVEPIADTLLEGSETFTATLLPGADYVIGATASEGVLIVDAKQRFDIQAVEPFAVVGGEPGLLRITRLGPRNEVTTIRLGTRGTATEGIDYEATLIPRDVPLPRFVEFNIGVSNLYVEVIALDEGDLGHVDSSHTLDVLIKPAENDSYLLGHNTEGRVRLLSGLSDFDSWAASTQDADPDMTSEELQTAESSRTGMASLLEYSFSYGVDFEDGLDSQEQVQFTPRLITEEEGIFVEYTQRMDDPNLEYIVEVSKDLNNWNRGEAYFEPVELDLADQNAGRVRYRILDEEGGNCFVRVVVNLNN